MTEIANSYRISRTFLYQLLLMATLQLETLFSDEKLLFQKDHRSLRTNVLFLLRLEGKLLASEHRFDFEGAGIPPPFRRDILSQFFQSAGQTLPSTS
jgi:hypothetical protein